MIIYKDILDKLKAAGYNTNRLRKDKLLGESSIQAIRKNTPITTNAINTICKLLNCQPGEIIEYMPDQEDNEIID